MEELVQLNIYEYLGVSDDPLHEQLRTLKVGEYLLVHGIKIALTQYGLYEISSWESHECYSQLEEVYQRSCEITDAANAEV